MPPNRNDILSKIQNHCALPAHQQREAEEIRVLSPETARILRSRAEHSMDKPRPAGQPQTMRLTRLAAVISAALRPARENRSP